MSEKDEKDERGNIIIVHSFDLRKKDMDKLFFYGNVFKYDDCYTNLPIHFILKEFKPHYLLFDIRIKSHRVYLTKMTKHVRDTMNFIVIVKWYELYDDFIDDIKPINILQKIPSKKSTKELFNLSLLQHISEPTCCLSFLKYYYELSKLYTFLLDQLKTYAVQQALITIGVPPFVIPAPFFGLF